MRVHGYIRRGVSQRDEGICSMQQDSVGYWGIAVGFCALSRRESRRGTKVFGRNMGTASIFPLYVVQRWVCPGGELGMVWEICQCRIASEMLCSI